MELNWLPIKDAPRDGTPVIVWPPTYPNSVTTGFFQKSILLANVDEAWLRSDASMYWSRENPPTHYMLLLRGPNGEEA